MNKLNLKWFGSLTNLSSKSRVPPGPVHDGSPWAEPTEARGPRGPRGPRGYARSSHMYTHVGTVPRGQREEEEEKKKKKKKSFRGLKKKKEEEEEGEGLRRGRGQWGEGDRVPDSPLLSVLSRRGPSPREPPARPLPAPPRPPHPSPLTSGRREEEEEEEEEEEVKRTTNMASGGKVTPWQDLYVPMDPIVEAAPGGGGGGPTQEVAEHRLQQEVTEPGKHLRQEVSDGGHRQRDVTGGGGGGGEYVKFSKEKFWLEEPSEQQRKQLEEELRLSGAELRSHAWYHGPIPGEVSESLVMDHGHFLIRDSSSSPGDFVLTCHWGQQTLHFPVRRSGGAAGPGRVQFVLEGQAFDSLPALVRFYAGGRALLSRRCPAQIHRPVNRTLPLAFLETAFGGGSGPQGPGGEGRGRPSSPSSLHHHQGAELSRGQTLSGPNNPASGPALPNHPIRAAPSPCLSLAPPTGSSPTGSLHRPRKVHQNQDPAPQSYVERLRAEEGAPGGPVVPRRAEDVHFRPQVEVDSSFRPGGYRSQLMPGDNKPLEVGILRRVKELLSELDPRTAAKHMTKADCTVARILCVSPEVQRMMGVSSGMELLTLPHGRRLRLDLLERFQTMATTLALDVLGCTGTTEERAALLHRIILIAAELKGTMGNMFGFAAVMRALELPQVSRLERTWTALRQRHTEGAVLYDKTLRPFMKSLNDGRESCPLSNTTFPHVLPLLSLLEKSAAVGEGAEPWETVEVGVDVVMFHLGAARTIAQLGGIYRSNAESRLQGFQEQAEVLELFLTDFQLRLLWGSRGAGENQTLRYSKFEQVLTALSHKLEPPVRSQRALC